MSDSSANDFSVNDATHMAQALHLAERGRYTAHPNPVVGCVIVNDGVVVGEGWHEKAGESHAEVHALSAAGEKARGATVYVTLEPCAHHGRTPPCASALIEAGVRRVVVATEDPNRVAARGLEILSDAGVETSSGLMQASAQKQNRGFFKRIATQRPFVCLKLASSIDGAIAMVNGESQWITTAAARADVQRLRARSGAIMTGIGTVLTDDPSLNVRTPDIETRGMQPVRVILDTHLRMPATSRMLTLPGTTLVCCAGEHDRSALQGANAEVLVVPENAGRVDVDAVLAALAEREINDVLVEAGPVLAGHLLDNDQVDELVIYQAPHIMGSETQGLVSTPSWSSLADRKSLTINDVRRIGQDSRITVTPEKAD